MAYATTTEVIDRMGYDAATSPAFLTRVEDAISAATTAIDNDTSRTFSSATATKEFGVAHRDHRSLWVPDLISVTTLKIDDDDDGTFETTIDAADYELDTYHTTPGWPFELVRLLARDFPRSGHRRRRIEIVGTWGWSAVPAPINQACSLLAARLAQRSNSALFGIQSFGDLGTQGIRSSDPDYQMLISPYRLHGIA